MSEIDFNQKSQIEKVYTLTDLIETGRYSNYNIADCSTLTKIGNSILTVGGCVFTKYYSLIIENCVNVTLTDDELYKYKYNPKKLSLDLYQTQELWYVLLSLNNISHEMDFKNKKIKVLNPSSIELLNKILVLNEDDIKLNHSEVLEI